MDNGSNAIEVSAPPDGYARAFNGELIKIKCTHCNYIYDDSDSYQPTWWRCNKMPHVDYLPTFPFKNGCKKHFVLHHTFTVDWEEEARKFKQGQ